MPTKVGIGPDANFCWHFKKVGILAQDANKSWHRETYGEAKGARKNNRDLQTYLRWKPGAGGDFFYTRIFFTPHIFFTISIFCLAAVENIDR